MLLGLLKGGVVGAAIGYGASRVGLGGGVVGYLLYAVIGGLVGLVCGKPLWKQETLWTPLLKAIVGGLVGVGLAFGAHKLLGGVHIPIAAVPGAVDHPLPDVPGLLGPAIGIVYGILIELDDAGGSGSAPAAAQQKTKKPA